MTANYYENQDTIAKNLIAFMREKGYSRLTLSKLSGIDRTEINQILSSRNGDESVYSSQMKQINQTFGLPDGYLLTSIQIDTFSPTAIVNNERSELAQELFDDLENLLDVYSMYIK